MATLIKFLSGQNQETLVLDRETSIVLPEFNTSFIVKSNISKIILSLFLLDISFAESKKVHLTINPFDPKTGEVDDGLAITIEPTKERYVDIELPRELFEKIVREPKKLLLKLVDDKTKLMFKGPDEFGTTIDPRLTVVNSDGSVNQEKPPTINNYYTQINNGSGDNVLGNKTSIENSPKPISLIKNLLIQSSVAIVTALALYYFFGIGK